MTIMDMRERLLNSQYRRLIGIPSDLVAAEDEVEQILSFAASEVALAQEPWIAELDRLRSQVASLESERARAIEAIDGELGPDDDPIVEACKQFTKATRLLPENVLDPDCGTLPESVAKLVSAYKDVDKLKDQVASEAAEKLTSASKDIDALLDKVAFQVAELKASNEQAKANENLARNVSAFVRFVDKFSPDTNHEGRSRLEIAMRIMEGQRAIITRYERHLRAAGLMSSPERDDI